jgi:murein peptide amidase A
LAQVIRSISAIFVRAAELAAVLFVLTAASASADTRASDIGTSQNGVPLTLYALGGGPKRVLIIGGQHGGPEANTVELVNGLLEYFDGNPQELPAGIELDILPVANPDGLSAGSRQFADGVDPDRNWGGNDWRTDAFDSNAVFRQGLGGPEPFSEVETQVLANWVLANRPDFIVNYHSAGGFMFGGRDGLAGQLSGVYAETSGYLWPQPGVNGQRSPLPYQASGSMNVWLRDTGIAAILVELSTPRSVEIERNLAGLKAVLAVLAAAR